MGLEVLDTLKSLGVILKNSYEEVNLFEDFIKGISNVLKSDVAFIDNKGYIVKEINSEIPSIGIKNELYDELRIEAQLINQLNGINENKLNVSLDNLYTTVISKEILKAVYGVFLPIFVSNERLGILIIYRKFDKFEQGFEIIAEYISTVLGILVSNNKNKENAEEERKLSIVKASISTLSYSELGAILSIFDELVGEEGLLIASKIADKAGITRSVIVNALRKFESAGVIESRSLGMKGTHIKVLNEYLLPEINKFKK